MVDWLLGYLGEALVLGQIRNVAVHLAIDLDALDDLVFVGLQPAVHVVEFHPGYSPRRCVVELRRQILREFVVDPVLFPAGNYVPAFFGDHPVHLRNLLRRVLQVCVHGHYDPSPGLLETTVKCC